MSYILDALKRADAERERGAVPGLHARQLTGPVSPLPRRVPLRVWLAVAALALAGVAATSVWFWQAPDAAGTLASVQPAAPVPTPVPITAPPTPTPLIQPAPIAVAPAASASPPVPKVASAAPRPAPRPVAPGQAAAVASQPQTRLDADAKEAPAQAAPPTIRAFKDLPEDLRRQIPALAITGSVYSKNPDQRLLLVNNQVLSRGSLAAPEVTLEEIQAKSSVFSFRGTRFRLPH